ncbi:MAG: hypothetical protein ACUVTR_02080 [Dehalococcoidia bacterium]
MPEKPLTQKVTRIIKDVDKLIQDVEKGIGRLIVGVKDLKQTWEKPEGEQKK